MCGRFSLSVSLKVLNELFGTDDEIEILPAFNIAPGKKILVCFRDPLTGTRRLVFMKWGFVPSWSKGPDALRGFINARSETVLSKPAFRDAARRRRCLIPADGFFEWKKAGKARQPHLFRLRDDGVFAFAGVWERGPGGNEEGGNGCAILTTLPNRVVEPVHDRMPVIVPRDRFGHWLEAEDPAPVLETLSRPFPPEEMKSFQVSNVVNKPGADSPECVRPIAVEGLLPFAGPENQEGD